MLKAVPFIQLFLLLVLSSLVILTLDKFNFLKLPKSAIYFFTNPISFGIYDTKSSIDKQFYFVFQARFAAQENKALKEQVGQIISENADLRRKLAETEALLTQQQHLDPQTYKLTSARPVGLERNLRLDKGSRNGLKVNQAVVFKDNYIGQIISISENGASVKLVTDPDSKLSAFSLGQEGRAKGILRGEFGSEMILDKILHEEKIKEGDLVYSEGTEGFLPRGLILGSVTQVLERENEVFKQAKVTPIFDIRDLELVFVFTE